MEGPLIPTFVLTVAALVLLFLVIFSVPFVSAFYFLSASVPGDTIRFGLWGFCFQQSGQCTAKTLGYQVDPEIPIWLTKFLVFFPIATAFTGLLLIAILPSVVLHFRRDTIYPPPLYSLLAIPAALTSLVAFAFMITLSTVAKTRFQNAGASAAYGPLVRPYFMFLPPAMWVSSFNDWRYLMQPWMSLAAAIILVSLMLYTGCGVTWRGPCGQYSPHIRNRWSSGYAY